MAMSWGLGAFLPSAASPWMSSTLLNASCHSASSHATCERQTPTFSPVLSTDHAHHASHRLHVCAQRAAPTLTQPQTTLHLRNLKSPQSLPQNNRFPTPSRCSRKGIACGQQKEITDEQGSLTTRGGHARAAARSGFPGRAAASRGWSGPACPSGHGTCIAH